ncbi:MAG: recombinase family protein [Myxacorys chilensis ATA2-1-KO14]|nr:recombinase family protein [Myxacorys chilensis ATA2-1-KO14]
MRSNSVWVTGASRSGKTTRLVNQFCEWVRPGLTRGVTQSAIGVLVLAAIGDNRLDLADRLTAATQGKCPFRSTTPLGFFEDEVMLFWSLLIGSLDLKATFPIRLRPENEQELATRLWRAELDSAIARTSYSEARLVRRILDLMQLASLSGITLDEIPLLLEQGVPGIEGQVAELSIPYATVGEMLQRWRFWCLRRGLLTYSLITELYWRYLLPNPIYQKHLLDRFQGVIADDVDEFPAIARQLFEVFLNNDTACAFGFNPDGAVRLGLGADPTYMAELASSCEEVALTRSVPSLMDDLGESIVELISDPVFFASLPDSIQTVQTTTQAQLIRQTGDVIVKAVQSGQIQPREIAIIGPGIDPISRYGLTEILRKKGIPVELLNDQRPLASSPIIRSLLTLLALIYPGLGRLVDRDAIAEMLVVLSQKIAASDWRSDETLSTSSVSTASFLIDPVRAGLIADYCFEPHPDHPNLMPATAFPRWDRLGYQAADAYAGIVKWVEDQRQQLRERLIASPVVMCDRALQRFFLGGSHLPFDQLAALRELIETAQHYWEVDDRLRRSDFSDAPASMTVRNFIQLLRNGTVTANPFPVRPVGLASNAVTLATVFQYRSSRRAHRWQFWLDAGSSRWLSGVDALFAAPIFLQHWSGQAWRVEDTQTMNEQRLRRIMLDLLGRTEEKLFLCYSDLSTSGQEQTGVLTTLVNAAIPINSDPIPV